MGLVDTGYFKKRTDPAVALWSLPSSQHEATISLKVTSSEACKILLSFFKGSVLQRGKKVKLRKEIANIQSYDRMLKSRNCSMTFSFLTRCKTFNTSCSQVPSSTSSAKQLFSLPIFQMKCLYFCRPHIRRHQSPPPHTKTKKYHST